MGRIRIIGGRKLGGSLCIQGSKNAVLPMIAASVLHEGKSVLHNCPRIADVRYMVDILRSLGAEARWEGGTLYLDCTLLNCGQVPRIYADKMRSSIIFLGALLGRLHGSAISHPGGCVIGPRPIDIHLAVLERLGARIQEQDGIVCAFCDELRGGEYVFPKISVGATQQAILAAVRAKGVTRLYNCAKEPEIRWLARYLNSRGADISGAETGTIVIRGVSRLCDAEYTVPPDRIVAGTYLCAGAITRSRIVLENTPLDEMGVILDVYAKMGGQYEVKSGKLIADSRGLNFPVPYLETAVYPGFPTDLQSPFMAVMATVPGVSRIRETIFEDRFKAARGLRQMGADIRVNGREAVISGGRPLRGTRLRAEELRGGAALILAGLAAEGETVVEGSEYIERGYEHICEDLSALGGRISKDTGVEYHEKNQLLEADKT